MNIYKVNLAETRLCSFQMPHKHGLGFVKREICLWALDLVDPDQTPDRIVEKQDAGVQTLKNGFQHVMGVNMFLRPALAKYVKCWLDNYQH